MPVNKTPLSRFVAVAVLVVIVALGAGCGGSTSNTQTGKVTAMQVGGIPLSQVLSGTVKSPTVAGVTVTTADGKKVAASVPANLAHSVSLRQTVEIKKVSGKWQVTRVVKQAPSGASTSPGTSTQGAPSSSTTTTPSTSATAPAGSIKGCIQRAGFTVSVKPPNSTDRNLGLEAKMEVTSSAGELHTIDIWRTPTDAQRFAYTGSGGYKPFGRATIDDASTPTAKKIESCLDKQ